MGLCMNFYGLTLTVQYSIVLMMTPLIFFFSVMVWNCTFKEQKLSE